MSDAWGPWIAHDGRGCPSGLLGKVVEVQAILFSGRAASDIVAVDHWIAKMGDWSHANFGTRGIYPCGSIGECGKITRYRIQKPKALRELIAFAENLPQTAALQKAPHSPAKVSS
ncbi:hypothetical protein [Yoonia sp. 208BN28-4]|uniref:hypothetical protein n=1 Tax=Yoonia sp. 208BN28-4 TaxID=3126505 RepID=UPI0030A0FF0D